MIDEAEFSAYVQENYPDVTDRFLDDRHMSGYCSSCNTDVAFRLQTLRPATRLVTSFSGSEERIVRDKPKVLVFSCPIQGCGQHKIWLVVELLSSERGEERKFLLNAIPSETEEIEGIPDNPPELRAAYKEAVRSLNANAPMAAAAMLRRALQVITRQVLGATPGNLANELRSLRGVENPLGIPLTQDFANNAYILKEAGNQGAHPDEDPDLLFFEPEDAEYLHEIFAEVVAELFVAPEAARRAREEFLGRRKISPEGGS